MTDNTQMLDDALAAVDPFLLNSFSVGHIFDQKWGNSFILDSMLNFGALGRGNGLGGYSVYPPISADLTPLSVASENTRRFSVTNLLELEDLQVRRTDHDTDRSEGLSLIFVAEVVIAWDKGLV